MTRLTSVIGGGPSGLASAIGLRRVLGEEAKIAIFERASSLKEVGGQIGLTKPAFNALRALDSSGELLSSIEKAGLKRKIFRRLDPEDNVEAEIKISEDMSSVVIPWFLLQRVLYDALPEKMLQLGLELDTLQENEDSVLLTFKGGYQCKTKIVVGADGNLSKVRSAIFEDEGLPEYAGSCAWRMFLRGNFDGIQLGETSK